MMIGGGLAAFFILIMMLAALRPAPTPEAPVPTPTTRPTRGPTKLEQELNGLDQVVRQAYPNGPILEPPPVDMEVRF